LRAEGAFAGNNFTTKNFGDAHRVPVFRCLLQLLSASLLSSLLSFWLPWIYSPFPFFMEFCNGLQLQLIECIESTRSEVKRKMIVRETRNVVPRSSRALAEEKFASSWARREVMTTLRIGPQTILRAQCTAQGNGCDETFVR